MDDHNKGFSYNAYIHVGHYEKPVASVDAKLATMTKSDKADDTESRDKKAVSGHVGCLAAIMMFRLNVHHPIGLKKFDLPRTDLAGSGYDADDSMADDSDADEYMSDESNSDFGECGKCDINEDSGFTDENKNLTDRKTSTDYSEHNISDSDDNNGDDSVFNGDIKNEEYTEANHGQTSNAFYNFYNKIGRHLSTDVSCKHSLD